MKHTQLVEWPNDIPLTLGAKVDPNAPKRTYEMADDQVNAMMLALGIEEDSAQELRLPITPPEKYATGGLVGEPPARKKRFIEEDDEEDNMIPLAQPRNKRLSTKWAKPMNFGGESDKKGEVVVAINASHTGKTSKALRAAVEEAKRRILQAGGVLVDQSAAQAKPAGAQADWAEERREAVIAKLKEVARMHGISMAKEIVRNRAGVEFVLEIPIEKFNLVISVCDQLLTDKAT